MNTSLIVQKIDRRMKHQTIRVYRAGDRVMAAYKVDVFDHGNGHVVAVDLDALRAHRAATGASYGHDWQFSTRYDSMDAFLAAVS